MEQIIINADDFGLKPSVNHAIVEAFNRGWINSTTLMATMPGFEEAIDLAHQIELQNNIGIHLSITEGKPLTRILDFMPFLFKRESHLQKLFMLNSYQKELIYREFSAQIERLKKNGIPITHLDTHHQVHDVWPINQILIKLLHNYRIPNIRILNNLEKSTLAKKVYRSVVNRFIFRANVHHSDLFGSQLDFLAWIDNNPSNFKTDKKIEIMVHPDFDKAGNLVDRLNGRVYDLNFKKKLEYAL